DRAERLVEPRRRHARAAARLDRREADPGGAERHEQASRCRQGGQQGGRGRMAQEAGPHQVTTHWTPLGGALRTGAAAAAWGDAGETEVFAVHDDGQVWDRYWDGKTWHAWESLGGAFIGQPAGAARGADRIDVFAISIDGALRH